MDGSEENLKKRAFDWRSVANQKIHVRESYLGQTVAIGVKKYRGTFEKCDWWQTIDTKPNVNKNDLMIKEQEYMKKYINKTLYNDSNVVKEKNRHNNNEKDYIVNNDSIGNTNTQEVLNKYTSNNIDTNHNNTFSNMKEDQDTRKTKTIFKKKRRLKPIL